jgi:transcriptional regulator with XRE-family HTH domain
MADLGKLTDGERLLIWRKRMGVNQRWAAQEFAVSYKIYSLIERDELPILKRLQWVPTSLEAHERCLLYRRRAGYTQKRVAEELEMSRYWINKMENGRAPCDDLLWYWEQ